MPVVYLYIGAGAKGGGSAGRAVMGVRVQVPAGTHGVLRGVWDSWELWKF